MDQRQAQLFSKKKQISQDCIVREEYEMVILQELFESSLREKLVFKGGTALRLIYKSARFSVDLDFSIIEKVSFGEVSKVMKSIVGKYQELRLRECSRKRYTFFSVLCIDLDWLSQPVSIKVEISRRRCGWKKDIDYKAMRINSEFSPLVTVGNTATLERIRKDKIQATKTRDKPRDVYDLWFVSARLQKDFTPPSYQYAKKQIHNDLNKLLPRPTRQYLKDIFQYEKN